MEAFFIYILKVAVLTAAFGILYHYLLKKETFHRFNRITLAVSLLLAYILPFFVISVSKPGGKIHLMSMSNIRTQRDTSGSAALRSLHRMITAPPMYRILKTVLRLPYQMS